MHTPQLHRVEADTPAPSLFANRWLPIGGAATLLLILCIWLLNRVSTHQPTVSAPTPVAQTAATTPTPAVAEPAPAPPPAPVAAAAQPGWHVIAYTFNREAQAQTRIAALAKQHPGLNPQLFTPTSRGPYLVALGGAMSQREAEAVRNRARRSGLPRDTFARLYK